MIRSAAEEMGDAVGDGTTTATILAQAIYAEGVRNVTAGASAIDMKRGLETGLRTAIETIRQYSKPVKTRKEKAQMRRLPSGSSSRSIKLLRLTSMMMLFSSVMR